MRKATSDDIPHLLAIELATQAAPWTVEVFQRCFQMNYDCWVIEHNQQVIAFIMMSSALTGESHILNLCVDPTYQHQGFGKLLLVYAITYAQQAGMEMIYLEVRRSNKNAIRLYDQFEFIQIGERKNYYPGDKEWEDALVFAKDLRV